MTQDNPKTVLNINLVHPNIKYSCRSREALQSSLVIWKLMQKNQLITQSLSIGTLNVLRGTTSDRIILFQGNLLKKHLSMLSIFQSQKLKLQEHLFIKSVLVQIEKNLTSHLLKMKQQKQQSSHAYQLHKIVLNSS